MSQPNTRWKALDGTYQIYIPLHLADLKFQKIIVTTIGDFLNGKITDCLQSLWRFLLKLDQVSCLKSAENT